MNKVFISYVREDADQVRRLTDELKSHGVDVWVDTDRILPGQQWAWAIRQGIRQGDYFIACFSECYERRGRTYMNEELNLAIEELRLRPSDRAWFIPVLISKCTVPDLDIGAGKTLRSIQWVELYKDWRCGLQKILAVVASSVSRTSRTQPAADIAPLAFSNIERLHSRDDALLGLGTGYRDLDTLVGGLRDAELIIVAAPPLMGKSCFAINIAVRIVSRRIPIAFFTLQMSSELLMRCMLAVHAHLDADSLHRGRLSNGDYQQLQESCSALSRYPLFLNDTAGISVMELRNEVDRLKREHSIRLVILDNLQLLRQRTPENGTSHLGVTSSLKELAEQLKIPVVALFRTDIATSRRTDWRPKWNDLPASVADVADVVLRLHRDSYYEPTDSNREAAEIIVAKNRSGATGNVQLKFLERFLRFEELRDETF